MMEKTKNETNYREQKKCALTSTTRKLFYVSIKCLLSFVIAIQRNVLSTRLFISIYNPQFQ